MTRCIIHIGMHKTGSSSIQKSLRGFQNEEFMYAALGADANHSLAIYSLFFADPGRHHLHRTRSDEEVSAYIGRAWGDLERAIAAARGRTLLISGEDIGVLPERDLIKLRNYFQSKFDEIVIAAYVRAPGSFLSSAFQQRVKGGTIRSFDVERLYRNYRISFGKFDQLFGRDKVQLWKFEPKTFPEGCVVQDFTSRLGISFPKERVVRVNESLPRQAVAMLYTYGKFSSNFDSASMGGQHSTTLGNLVVRGGDKFRFSPDLVRPILERNRSDIEWMEARLGQSLDEKLGEHQPGDVREEADLLQPDREIVARLLKLLGSAAPKGVAGETAEQLAILVHALRVDRLPRQAMQRTPEPVGQARGRPQGRSGNGQMRVSDIIEEMRQANPMALNGISEKDAQEFVSNLFKHMNGKLAAAEEGIVAFAGLGQFRVSKVEKEVEGATTTLTRFGFRPAEHR